MRVRVYQFWDFNIKEKMEELGYKSFRQLAKKVGIHWTHLNKIANGMACDEKTASLIIRKMTESKINN